MSSQFDYTCRWVELGDSSRLHAHHQTELSPKYRMRFPISLHGIILVISFYRKYKQTAKNFNRTRHNFMAGVRQTGGNALHFKHSLTSLYCILSNL